MTMKNLYLTAAMLLTALYMSAQCPVVLTIDDSANKDLVGVKFKGSYDGWASSVNGFDDGTNGDATAGDNIWSLQVQAASDASYEWGAEGTTDGTAYGWLLNGVPNRSFTLTGCTASGQTSYAIPLAAQKFPVILTIIDGTQSVNGFAFKGSYAGWADQAAFDDGTHGDAVAGDHIWSLEVMAEGGMSHQWGANNTDCNPDSWIIVGPNRVFDVSGTGAVTGEVSYEIPAPMDVHNVTFSVDMSDEIVNSTGLFAAGNFQTCAWSKNTIELTDTDGDQIYTVTVPIPRGSYTFKYFNGDDGNNGDTYAETYNFLAGGCGVESGVGGYNRTLDLSTLSADLVLPIMKYNSCQMTPSAVRDLTIEQFDIKPNPASSSSTTITFSGSDPLNIIVSSITGQVIHTQNQVRSTTQLNTSTWAKGMYFVTLRNEQGLSVSKKLIVQ